MPKTLWIGEADDSEQGSFSNRDSGHLYQNGNLTDMSEQEANAIERDDEIVFLDAPIDQAVPYEVDHGTRFNMYSSEDDSQNVPTPSVYGPGR